MHLITVGSASLNQTPLDWAGNLSRILSAIQTARSEGVQLLCLPELCISGYGCEDMFHAHGVIDKSGEMLLEIASKTQGMAVAVGLPVLANGAVFNAAALLVDGKIAGLAAKKHLAGDGLHYEPRWFKPWPSGARSTIQFGGVEYPLGDLYFDLGGVKVGFEICEDAWVSDRSGISLAKLGIDLILNPSASHFAFGKQEVRKRIILEGSRAGALTYLYSNLLGCESGRIIYDGGPVIASEGSILAEGRRFSFADFVLAKATVDLDKARLSRMRVASYEPALATDERSVKLSWKPAPQNSGAPTKPMATIAGDSKEEEFARAVSLGLFDYLRKSRSKGYVVSISGGADSAAVTLLVAMMVRFGWDELGANGFKAKLGYVEALSAAKDIKEAVAILLAAAYQRASNSSKITEDAAKAVADAAGARFFLFDVAPFIEQYGAMISSAVGRKLNWQTDDLSLQNIQARARAPGIWLLANVREALLLVTSNRSEAAVGYATMDGDTSGGLAPLGGIDKAYLREWLKWVEKTGPVGFGPVPALALVNVQAPTAELRPPERKQTDEGDLMPYVVLDFIERVAIRDKKMPAEAYQIVCAQFEGAYSSSDLKRWVVRFFRLWARSQWKRERYAPSFHLDDENLDPKTWCRFPILSGGFEAEIAELEREH